MKYDIVIRGGEIVTPNGSYVADIGIQGESIAAIGEHLEGKEIIEADGKLVLPGAIDVHTHFQLPFCGTQSADDFENGSKAAAFGGVTMFIDFAIPQKGASIIEAVEARQAEADPKVCVDYGLHAAITDWTDERAAEIPDLVEMGIPSFKMFMIYKAQGWQADDADLYRALRLTARLGAMVGVHAENDPLITLLQAEVAARPDFNEIPGCYAHTLSRPTITESEAISRAVQIAESVEGNLYIFHMSTGEGARIVAEGQARGVNVYAETGPHYLLLDDELFKRPDGHLFGTCPPIRTPSDQVALWDALAGGTVDILATDTCTFTSQQKAMWNGDFRKIPFGMPGIETLLPLAWTFGVLAGNFTQERMVELLSENPAQIFGMWPRKGTIRVGSDADLVVFDPDIHFTLSPDKLHHNCDYTPFDGMAVQGWPTHTLVRGRVIVRDRVFVGEAGYGRFIPREPPFEPNEDEE